MAKRPKKIKKAKPKLVPRLGPPANLRPAGVHEGLRKKTRAEIESAALAEEVAALERSGVDE